MQMAEAMYDKQTAQTDEDAAEIRFLQTVSTIAQTNLKTTKEDKDKVEARLGEVETKAVSLQTELQDTRRLLARKWDGEGSSSTQAPTPDQSPAKKRRRGGN